MFEHRVGLINASDAERLTHVQVHLIDMSPLPRHRLNNYEEPVFPYALPMASDGDKSIGITLPPGRERSSGYSEPQARAAAIGSIRC
jgi:hypothetical protein